MTEQSKTPATPTAQTLPNPQQVNDLRQRVLNGEQVPVEELAAAIATLRQGRVSAMANAKTSRAKKKVDPQEELDNLLGSVGL